jgi:L-alanine-DL-glutamate epimerase-like enolase superfamily enzyme
MEGTDAPEVKDSHIAVPDAPGLGLMFIQVEARKYLREEDSDFFDD